MLLIYCQNYLQTFFSPVHKPSDTQVLVQLLFSGVKVVLSMEMDQNLVDSHVPTLR